jgi:hypothetical protein
VEERDLEPGGEPLVDAVLGVEQERVALHAAFEGTSRAPPSNSPRWNAAK